MRSLSLLAGGVVFLAGVFAVPAVSAQFQVATAGRDYSFTISTAQPWTDTGVDLQAGDVVQIHATSADSCDPAGVSGASSAGLPVVSAPAGALIARLQAQAAPVLIGSGKQLAAEGPGHLFLGVNASGAPPCSGSFAVKVHIAAPATPAAGNSLTAGSPSATSPSTASTSTPSQPAASSTGAQKPVQDMKSKLASAAQVFLAGQFGGGASSTASSSSAVAPAGNDVVSPTSTTTASASTPVALKVSSTKLDSALEKDIDSLPRRVNDQFNNQGDMVNFVLVGSEQQVKDALDAAGWRVADTDNKEAVLKAVLETYQKKDYLQMPMSQLYLFGRKQDYGYELAQAYSVVASRHHFRIWKAPVTWNGQTMWAGAGTHDIGFEKDQRNGSVTHKIDPAVDGERDNIGQTLQASGKVKSLSYYLPPDPVQGAKNATGGGYHSDGRILVIQLQ
ncbi:MAG TPA: LssY C-terminal domain-containing protein [Terriglobales bacterium]|nr:LssY C-terminal domain-containing protein [Terriglobales bacterium]